MTETSMKKEYKMFLMFLLGIFILVLGITFILVWWEDVMSLCRGIIGFVMAVGGLLVLYSIKK